MPSRRLRWFVYILQAADRTLYTGIARNVDKRLQTHLSGRGSRYLRGKTPLKLIYKEVRFGRSSALKREAGIKNLTRTQKMELVSLRANAMCHCEESAEVL